MEEMQQSVRVRSKIEHPKAKGDIDVIRNSSEIMSIDREKVEIISIEVSCLIDL